MNGLVRHSVALGAGCALAICGASAVMAQNSGGSAPTQPQSQGAQHTIQLVQARAELAKTLDAKKTKQGQPVTAKLEENIRIPNAQELPKNTILEGHVDQVKASQHRSQSTLTITFDKAKLKSGQELPIKATVIAVSEPALASLSADGGAPGAPGGAPGAAPGPSPAPAGGASGGPGAAGAPAPPPSMNMPSENQGLGSRSQAKQSGVPGVSLTSSIHDQTSATFTSQGRNVHVPGGTQLAMALAVIPPGVKLQQ